jgi:hypothetical protein
LCPFVQKNGVPSSINQSFVPIPFHSIFHFSLNMVKTSLRPSPAVCANRVATSFCARGTYCSSCSNCRKDRCKMQFSPHTRILREIFPFSLLCAAQPPPPLAQRHRNFHPHRPPLPPQSPPPLPPLPRLPLFRHPKEHAAEHSTEADRPWRRRSRSGAARSRPAAGPS